MKGGSSARARARTSQRAREETYKLIPGSLTSPGPVPVPMSSPTPPPIVGWPPACEVEGAAEPARLLLLASVAPPPTAAVADAVEDEAAEGAGEGGPSKVRDETEDLRFLLWCCMRRVKGWMGGRRRR